jgi:preprotein translocase subunit SecB
MAKAMKGASGKDAKAEAKNGGESARDVGPAVAAAVKPPAAGTLPSMKILGQYLKDLSFENPNAPQSMNIQSGSPDINIAVNVNARNLAPTDFEVELHLEAKATHQGKAVFAADLLYAGIFRLENVPPEALHPIVLVECPRLLFPFARQILADATRNGGFPPLMLDPIDFMGMYQRRLAEQKKVATA